MNKGIKPGCSLLLFLAVPVWATGQRYSKSLDRQAPACTPKSAYVKTLEKRLVTTEKENKLLKLKIEALEAAIQLAVAPSQRPIPTKSGSAVKRSCH